MKQGKNVTICPGCQIGENVVLEDIDITSQLGAEFIYSKAVTMKNVTIRNAEGEQVVTRFCEDME